MNSIVKTYSTSVSSYKIDFGLQWEQKLLGKEKLTIGATYGLGHKLGADAEATTSNSSSITGVSDKTTDVVKNAFSLPTSFGVGLTWRHSNRWVAGIDYTFQKWGELDYPNLILRQVHM